MKLKTCSGGQRGACCTVRARRALCFFRRIVEEGPRGIEPLPGDFPWDRTPAGGCGDYRLIYLGEHQPRHFENGLPERGRYAVDVIDTWDMQIETLGVFEGKVELELPGRPHLALRVRPIE